MSTPAADPPADPNPPKGTGSGTGTPGFLAWLWSNPRIRLGVRRLFALAIAAAVPAGQVEVANEPDLLIDEHRAAGDSAVWIAQITDPHLFEEFKPGRSAAANEVENQRSFRRALRFVGSGRATDGHVPDALVITGDFGIDSSFLSIRPDSSKLAPAEQVATIARLLRRSPVKQVYVVIGNNDLPNEKADSAAFGYFHRFIEEVSRNVSGAGIKLTDLTGCYAGAPARSCAADLRYDIRLVGFASASFKNTPKADSTERYDTARRALRADSSRAWDSTAVERLASVISAADNAGKQEIVLTHEPDIDDPFARSQIARSANAARLDPAIWNVAAPVRTRWVNAVTGGSVLAVIAGHLHSADSADYVRRHTISSPRGTTDPVPVFVSPPLAVKNQDTASPQARGISFYRIDREGIRRVIAWLDGDAFRVAQTAAIPSPPSGVPRTPADRPSAGLSTSARIGIAFFAMLAAALGIMGGFKMGMEELLEKGGTREQFSWLEHVWFLPAIGTFFIGLALSIALFANTWGDRSEVAMWYGADFLASLLGAVVVAQLSRPGVSKAAPST
jgi:3',5'-cyclic AMP phosphodiesterase CpdA